MSWSRISVATSTSDDSGRTAATPAVMTSFTSCATGFRLLAAL
jgi:hypothetical protein